MNSPIALSRSLAGNSGTVFHDLQQGLHQRSRALVAFLDLRMETLIGGWLAVCALVIAAKLALAIPMIHGRGEAVQMALPFALAALAPLAGYVVATGSFPRSLLSGLPEVQLCRYGAWRRLTPLDARQSPAFGPFGFMASLILGILLNVPFRTFEFMLAMPMIPENAPAWAQTMLVTMTADVVVMNFFYMVAFVMALRAVPLFPRMMLFAWAADIVMQFIIAGRVAVLPDLPASVSIPLQNLLHGNIEKVLISAFVWLPYLILSDRVNVTFRRRVRV